MPGNNPTKPSLSKLSISLRRNAIAEAIGDLNPADLAATVTHHNENVLALLSRINGWTPEQQAEMREKIGDLSACWVGDGAAGMTVMRDSALLPVLAAVYRLQSLADTEGETVQ